MHSQEIKCNVETCKYNNQMQSCTLNDILVGSSTAGSPHMKAETECVSFEEQGK